VNGEFKVAIMFFAHFSIHQLHKLLSEKKSGNSPGSYQCH